MHKPHDAAKFWDYADRSAGPDGCWPWTGAFKGGTGYGSFSLNRRQMGAHRVAWHLANKAEIPSGSYICHHCDNRACINPAHLFVGSPLDNVSDMLAKGRHSGPVDDNRRKLVCPCGHPYDRLGRRANGQTFRVCSICQARRSRQTKARIRARRAEKRR